MTSYFKQLIPGSGKSVDLTSTIGMATQQQQQQQPTKADTAKSVSTAQQPAAIAGSANSDAVYTSYKQEPVLRNTINQQSISTTYNKQRSTFYTSQQTRPSSQQVIPSTGIPQTIPSFSNTEYTQHQQAISSININTNQQAAPFTNVTQQATSSTSHNQQTTIKNIQQVKPSSSTTNTQCTQQTAGKSVVAVQKERLGNSRPTASPASITVNGTPALVSANKKPTPTAAGVSSSTSITPLLASVSNSVTPGPTMPVNSKPTSVSINNRSTPAPAPVLASTNVMSSAAPVPATTTARLTLVPVSVPPATFNSDKTDVVVALTPRQTDGRVTDGDKYDGYEVSEMRSMEARAGRKQRNMSVSRSGKHKLRDQHRTAIITGELFAPPASRS